METILPIMWHSYIYYEWSYYQRGKTYLWFDTWINHKSLVHLFGWNRIHLSNTVSSKVCHIIRDGQFQPQLISETREVANQILQVKIASDNPTDYWTIDDNRKFLLSTIWNSTRLSNDNDDNFKVIWHNKTAKKFSFIAYMAYVQRLPTAGHLYNWGILHDTRCV